MNKNIIIKCLGLIFILMLYKISFAQNYFLHSYDLQPDSTYHLYLKKIDLQSKSVQDSILISSTGTIMRKKPIEVKRGNKNYLISFISNGLNAKNSENVQGGDIIYFKVILDFHNNINLVFADSLKPASLEILTQFKGHNKFRLAIKNYIDSSYYFDMGEYSINQNNRFSFIRPVSSDDIPGKLIDIDGFGSLLPIPEASNYNLYYSFHNSQYWLLKLNSNLDHVIDSLQLRESGGQATLFSYHPTTDNFFCFHLNYEMHGKYTTKNREDYYITPELLIYDSVTLGLLERHLIDDYPDGNYPGRENGIADVVGDYIVYYFFEDDWMGIYAPAMLFIFDTRTNETTWLRVGWR